MLLERIAEKDNRRFRDKKEKHKKINGRSFCPSGKCSLKLYKKIIQQELKGNFNFKAIILAIECQTKSLCMN